MNGMRDARQAEENALEIRHHLHQEQLHRRQPRPRHPLLVPRRRRRRRRPKPVELPRHGTRHLIHHQLKPRRETAGALVLQEIRRTVNH